MPHRTPASPWCAGWNRWQARSRLWRIPRAAGLDLFGMPLARRLGLPYQAVLLKRERPRPENTCYSSTKRGEAVRGAFAIRKGRRVDNLRILLLDHVMTSGATLDACSRALREAGARSVAGPTIARAVRQAIPVRESA